MVEILATVLTGLAEEHGCYDRRHWRCDLRSEVDAAKICSLLVERGWRSRCRHPKLKSLVHPEGHEIAWVVSTGRIQIRIDPQTAAETRQAVAQSLHRDFETAIRNSHTAPVTAISRRPRLRSQASP